MNSKWSHSVFVFAILLALVSYCIPYSIYAQSYINIKKLSRTTLIFNNSNIIVEGVLFPLNNDSLTLALNFNEAAYLGGLYNLYEYPITSIDMIKIYNPKKKAWFTFLGTVVGFVTGAVITGNFYGDEFLDGFIVFGGGVVGGIAGAFIGARLGHIKIKIPINGDVNTYYLRSKKLKRHVFTP
jgi:hypothetical protein